MSHNLHDAYQIPAPLLPVAGVISNISGVHRIGLNLATGNAAQETVATMGGLFIYPTEAIIMSISSDDANDDDGDAGARTVEIQGLDANFLVIGETLTLNGQAGVNTTLEYIRVHRMQVRTAGGSGINEGIIYLGSGAIDTGVPAVIYLQIDAGEGRELSSNFTIPDGVTGYITHFIASSLIGSAAEMTFRIVCRLPDEVFVTLDYIVINRDSGIVTILHDDSGIPVPARTDIEVRAIASAGEDVASVQMDLLLVDQANGQPLPTII